MFETIYGSFFFACSDIKSRYRRTLLGPWWLTLTFAFYAIGLQAVFSRLTHNDSGNYFFHILAGLLFWNYFSTVINEGAAVFTNHSHLIKSYSKSLWFYPLRIVLRSLFILAHHWIVAVGSLLLFSNFPKSAILTGFPVFLMALLLVTLILVHASMIVALLGARFRDCIQVIATMIQLAFFVSPITWEVNDLSNSLFRYNPITYLVDLMRAPLLGQWPQSISWVVAGISLAVLLMVSFALYERYKSRVVFWVG